MASRMLAQQRNKIAADRAVALRQQRAGENDGCRLFGAPPGYRCCPSQARPFGHAFPAAAIHDLYRKNSLSKSSANAVGGAVAVMFLPQPRLAAHRAEKVHGCPGSARGSRFMVSTFSASTGWE